MVYGSFSFCNETINYRFVLVVFPFHGDSRDSRLKYDFEIHSDYCLILFSLSCNVLLYFDIIRRNVSDTKIDESFIFLFIYLLSMVLIS